MVIRTLRKHDPSIFLPLLCAALGFATASCSQSDGRLGTAAEAPASGPASRGAAAAAMPTPPEAAQTTSSEADPMPLGSSGSFARPADASPSPNVPPATATARRASTLIGMPVVSANGSSLGKVKDIIFDAQGRATHLVIAYGMEPQGPADEMPEGTRSATDEGSRLTALPWDAAMAIIKDGQLVLDGAKLQSAPSFTQDTWPDLDNPGWSAVTDAYWRKAVRAAIEAHPGAPIDSTARRRARPTRGGG